MQKLLKDSASKSKMEWIYINRICFFVVTFIATMIFTTQLHKLAIDYVYTEPTTRTQVLGTMSDKDLENAQELTEQDNYFINKLKGDLDITVEQIKREMVRSKYYTETDENLDTDAERILEKLNVVNSEGLKIHQVKSSTHNIFGNVQDANEVFSIINDEIDETKEKAYYKKLKK